MKLLVALSLLLSVNASEETIDNLFQIDGTKSSIKTLGKRVHDGLTSVSSAPEIKSQAMELRYAIEKFKIYPLVKMMSSMELNEEEISLLSDWAKKSNYVKFLTKEENANAQEVYNYTRNNLHEITPERLGLISSFIRLSGQMEVSLAMGFLSQSYLSQGPSRGLASVGDEKSEMAMMEQIGQTLAVQNAFKLRHYSDKQVASMIKELGHPLVQKYLNVKNKHIVSSLEKSFTKLKSKRLKSSFMGGLKIQKKKI